MPEQSQPVSNNTKNAIIVTIGCLIVFICILVTVFIVLPLLVGGAFLWNIERLDVGTNTANEAQTGISPNTYKLNEVVKTGNIEWVVTKAENLGETLPSSFQFVNSLTLPNTKFIRIELTAKNTGTEKETIWDNIKIVDSSNKTYSISSNDYINLKSSEKSSLFMDIPAGGTKSMVNIYEMPAKVSGLKLEVSDLNLVNPLKAYINLEL